ncbi:MAG: hypothetical protein EZS28_037417, partial [Streblomastix strix]
MSSDKILITDLDNTLWNWFNDFHEKWYYVLNTIVFDFHINKEDFYLDVHKIEKDYGTIEFFFLFERYDCLKEGVSKEEWKRRTKILLEGYNEIDIHNYYSNLYEDVYEVLEEVKRRGIKIIGVTNANYRLACLRLRKYGFIPNTIGRGLFTDIFASDNCYLGDIDFDYKYERFFQKNNPIYRLQGFHKP